jgi:hypothetical protein
MSTTLVIILSQTRASELTFDNFKKNIIDELNADLCVCIGVKPDYDYNNPFYNLAKYKFTYDEPDDDFGDAFEYAYNIISSNKPNDERKSLHWREFLKIKYHGWGVKGACIEDPASSGILLFFRWFLLKNLIDNDLINKYDRFIITRSDFIYQLPHPKVEFMNKNNIWIPDCEYYGGYTDRHVVLSKNNIKQYLNIFNNMVLHSNEYFMAMKDIENKANYVNLERLIKLHFIKNNILHLVKEFPYIMYSVRNINGSTRWCKGDYSEELGYYIKYKSEYEKSIGYKKEFENSGLTIDEFYKKKI